jgi:hypothetical protein
MWQSYHSMGNMSSDEAIDTVQIWYVEITLGALLLKLSAARSPRHDKVEFSAVETLQPTSDLSITFDPYHTIDSTPKSHFTGLIVCSSLFGPPSAISSRVL